MPSQALIDAMMGKQTPGVVGEEENFRQMQARDPANAAAIGLAGSDQRIPAPYENMRLLASMLPVIGNVMAAKDAYDNAGQVVEASKAGDIRGQRKAATMTGLSLLGAMSPLPWGGAAGRAAEGATSRANIFAGPMAKTADHAALAKAQEMTAAGVGRDAIHAQTGWFRGVDGKWRFEIDDSAARLSGEKYLGGGVSGFTGLEHPGFTSAYGETPPIYGGYEAGKRPSGSYHGASGGNASHIEAQGGNAAEARSVTLHELQHDLQAKEGFAPGGTPSQMADIWGPEAWRVRVPMETKLVAEDLGLAGKPIYSGMPEYDRLKEAVRQSIEDKSGKPFKFRYRGDGMDEFDWDFGSTMRTPKEEIGQRTMLGLQGLGADKYDRLAGEVEARNVQSRMDMTAAERRAKAPWLTQAIPDEQQIVRSGLINSMSK